ncbi:MAG: ABC transporter permease [Clostridiales bacterium]|nr:ABC transporter permease [Clostridiales bacterium]
MKKQKNEHELYIQKSNFRKVKIVVIQILILICFLGLWELAAQLGWIDSFITSSPSRVIAMLGDLSKQNLWLHIGTTLYECVIGFVISTLLGCAIAVVLWWSDFLRRVLEPYIVVLNSLPKIALGPIIIIWVGAGAKAIVMMTVLICLIVTIISALGGLMEIDEGKILLMRSMGATKWQILTKLVLPGSLPTFLSVLKINVGLAWVGTIMGEYLVSGAGLGYLIIYGGQVFKLDLVMTSTVILCFLAAIMYFAVALAERLLKRK